MSCGKVAMEDRGGGREGGESGFDLFESINSVNASGD
jgi:hypothetical protein